VSTREPLPLKYFSRWFAHPYRRGGIAS